MNARFQKALKDFELQKRDAQNTYSNPYISSSIEEMNQLSDSLIRKIEFLTLECQEFYRYLNNIQRRRRGGIIFAEKSIDTYFVEAPEPIGRVEVPRIWYVYFWMNPYKDTANIFLGSDEYSEKGASCAKCDLPDEARNFFVLAVKKMLDPAETFEALFKRYPLTHFG